MFCHLIHSVFTCLRLALVLETRNYNYDQNDNNYRICCQGAWNVHSCSYNMNNEMEGAHGNVLGSVLDVWECSFPMHFNPWAAVG